jgi:ABC-type branched-subunit amino acid transport system substrate-binding protein
MGNKDSSGKTGRFVVSRREFLASAGITAAAALTGVSVAFAQEKNPVKVGFLLPEQGPFAMECKSLMSGFQLLLQERRADAPPVEIIKKDPGPNDESALEALAELIAIKDAYFIVAPPSLKGSEQVIHGVAGANRIVFVTNPTVRLVAGEMCLPTAFRIRSNTYQCGYSLSTWALKNIGVKAFLCGNDEPEANEVTDFFANGFERAGGTFVDRVMLPPDSQDFGNILEAVKASDANLVFAAFAGNSAAAFMKAAASASPALKQAVIGPESLTAFPLVVDQMKGITFSARTATSVRDPQEFARILKEKANAEASDVARAAEGYDLAQVILASERGDQSGEKDIDRLVNAIAEMTINGPRGKFTFDKNHEPVLDMLVQEWQFSGQTPQRKMIENIGPVKTPDLGCGRIGFPRKPESEIKDEEPVWEEKDQ